MLHAKRRSGASRIPLPLRYPRLRALAEHIDGVAKDVASSAPRI